MIKNKSHVVASTRLKIKNEMNVKSIHVHDSFEINVNDIIFFFY
jgi:hypothetical protein